MLLVGHGEVCPWYSSNFSRGWPYVIVSNDGGFILMDPYDDTTLKDLSSRRREILIFMHFQYI